MILLFTAVLAFAGTTFEGGPLRTIKSTGQGDRIKLDCTWALTTGEKRPSCKVIGKNVYTVVGEKAQEILDTSAVRPFVAAASCGAGSCNFREPISVVCTERVCDVNTPAPLVGDDPSTASEK